MGQTGWTRVTVFLPINSTDEILSARESLSHLSTTFEFLTFSEVSGLINTGNVVNMKYIVVQIEENRKILDAEFSDELLDLHFEIQRIYTKNSCRQKEIRITSLEVIRHSFTEAEAYNILRSLPTKRV